MRPSGVLRMLHLPLAAQAIVAALTKPARLGGEGLVRGSMQVLA
jgi:hypothetical protein